MNEKDWIRLRNKKMIIALIGLILMTASVILYVNGWPHNPYQVVGYVLAIMAGFSFGTACLDNMLIKEYGRQTRKRW